MRKNQKIKAAIYMLVSVDKVIVKKDGTVEARAYFFYRHGGTAEKFADKIIANVPGVAVTEQGERWQAWPKDSYWWVRFEIMDFDALFGAAEALIEKAQSTWEEVYEEMKVSWS